MRKRYHILPCGIKYHFYEYTLKELVPVYYMRNNVQKDKLAEWINPETTGRKWDPICKRIGTNVLRTFFSHLVDTIMESNWVSLPDDVTCHIGTIPTNPKRITKDRNKNVGLLHTDGKWKGVVFRGLMHNCYIRMPQRRREELYKRIVDGQDFMD